MQQTFRAIPPKDIVAEFVKVQDQKPAALADALWDMLGEDTRKVMANGAICLAQLWDSAWKEGGGDNTIHDLGEIDEFDAGDAVSESEIPAVDDTRPDRLGSQRRSDAGCPALRRGLVARTSPCREAQGAGETIDEGEMERRGDDGRSPGSALDSWACIGDRASPV